jgi:hypothetical protein
MLNCAKTAVLLAVAVTLALHSQSAGAVLNGAFTSLVAYPGQDGWARMDVIKDHIHVVFFANATATVANSHSRSCAANRWLALPPNSSYHVSCELSCERSFYPVVLELQFHPSQSSTMTHSDVGCSRTGSRLTSEGWLGGWDAQEAVRLAVFVSNGGQVRHIGCTIVAFTNQSLQQLFVTYDNTFGIVRSIESGGDVGT